jgi:hypothetical protein
MKQNYNRKKNTQQGLDNPKLKLMNLALSPPERQDSGLLAEEMYSEVSFRPDSGLLAVETWSWVT